MNETSSAQFVADGVAHIKADQYILAAMETFLNKLEDIFFDPVLDVDVVVK